MSDRYPLLVESLREAARTVSIIAGIAAAILAARWSIRFIPKPVTAWVQDLFDMWLVLCILVLFVISK